MDNKNRSNDLPENDNWLDEILGKTNETDAIGPDEQAIFDAPLTHPDDLELERIVQETMAENWGSEETNMETEPQAPAEQTQFFSTRDVQARQTPKAKEKRTAPKRDKKINMQEIESAIEKIRPKMKKGYGLLGIPHILATMIWLAIIVTIGVTLGRTLWVCAADVLAFGRDRQEIILDIEETDDLDTISQKLGDAGLVKYPGLFKLFVELTGKEDNIEAGRFTLNTIYDYNAMVNAMSNFASGREEVEITIPEGYTCAQIFALLEEKGVCSAWELEEYAANGELDDYWFLEGVQRGHKYCLEGYMFPDTYRFYTQDKPKRVIEKFLDDFDYRFSDRMQQKLVALNESSSYLKMDIRQIVIMASIIEKESAGVQESYTISSVFYNRLRNPASFPFLNSDATLDYDIYTYRAKEFWDEDKVNSSPYNTRTQRGLPAGAICNPGLDSLDAALDPEDTDYFYFVYDKTAGYSLFSKTLSEHNAKARKLGLA